MIKSDDIRLIEFTLFTYINLQDRNIGKKFLSILYDKGWDFAPEKIDYGKNWKVINPHNYPSFIGNWVKAKNILLRRENTYKSEIAILLGNSPSTPRIMSCWVEEPFFLSPLNIERFLEISKLLYYLLHPDYGLIHQVEEMIIMTTVKDPKYGKTILPINLQKGIPGIYWANFFGPKHIEKIGREKFISAKCYKVEELNDGGLMLVTGPSPLENADPEIIKERKEIRDYLGKENFYP